MKTNRADQKKNYCDYKATKSKTVQGASAKRWNGDI